MLSVHYWPWSTESISRDISCHWLLDRLYFPVMVDWLYHYVSSFAN